MTGAADWGEHTWIRQPVVWDITSTGALTWTTRAESDFWRHTGGVVGADDGDAFLVTVAGDFTMTMHLRTTFDSPYDQCGLMVRADGRNWLKAGVEWDERPWFSVVETRGTSDWSKQATTGASVEFTLWRSGDTLRVGLTVEDSLHLVRELVFDGSVAVGPYSCAPKGPGFPVQVTRVAGPDARVVFDANAGVQPGACTT